MLDVLLDSWALLDSLTCLSWTLDLYLLEMNGMRVLSVLSLMNLWVEPGSEAMSLDFVVQCRRGDVGGHIHTRRRSRRSWVWNQFFVLEEFTGDEPLYVGKVGHRPELVSDWTTQTCEDRALNTTHTRLKNHLF